ncbi:MAG: FkbM family methyltransferase [Ginsengibacter sp.]
MRKLILLLKYFNQLGTINFIDYLGQRFIKRNKIIGIKTPGLDEKILLRNNPSDIQVFTQIFINREYDVTENREIKTIIDCGANIGLASLFFLSKFPGARIVAIEPEENNFQMLIKNLSSYKNVTCIKKGIWDKKANLEIVDNGWGNAGFVIKESPIVSSSTIEAISISMIMEEFELDEIDILKMDIEGSEEQVFSSNPEWIKKVSLILCEIHENLKPGLSEKIESILAPCFNSTLNGEYHVFTSKANFK